MCNYSSVLWFSPVPIGLTIGLIIGIIQVFHPDVWNADYARIKIAKDSEIDNTMIISWYNLRRLNVDRGLKFHVFGSNDGENVCTQRWRPVDLHIPVNQSGQLYYEDRYNPSTQNGEFRFTKPSGLKTFVVCGVKGTYTYVNNGSDMLLPCYNWHWGLLRATNKEVCVFDDWGWMMLFGFVTIILIFVYAAWVKFYFNDFDRLKRDKIHRLMHKTVIPLQV